jgi:hypothetical protein
MPGAGPLTRTTVLNPVSGSTAPTGTQNVAVQNFPATQPVSGTVAVSNLPATQPVSGTVAVSNFPATQAVSVSGTVTVATHAVTQSGAWSVSLAPNASAANGIVPTRATNTASLLIKNTAGNLYSAYAVAGNTGFILVALDRTTALAANAAITATEIINMAPVSANGFASISPTDVPDRFVNGFLLIASTSITTYSPPSNLPIFIRGKAI